MDKRSFLKMIMATGFATALPASAFASRGGDRYHRLISQQLLIHAKSRETADVTPDVTPEVSKLLDILQADFNGSEDIARDRAGMIAGINEILHGRLLIDTMSEIELRRYENCLVSIAVIRGLVKRRYKFYSDRDGSWGEFVKTYVSVLREAY